MLLMARHEVVKLHLSPSYAVILRNDCICLMTHVRSSRMVEWSLDLRGTEIVCRWKTHARSYVQFHLYIYIYITLVEDSSAASAKRRYRETAIKRNLFTVCALMKTRKRGDRDFPRTKAVQRKSKNFLPPHRNDRSRTRAYARTCLAGARGSDPGWQEQHGQVRPHVRKDSDRVPPHVVHYVLCAYSL